MLYQRLYHSCALMSPSRPARSPFGPRRTAKHSRYGKPSTWPGQRTRSSTAMISRPPSAIFRSRIVRPRSFSLVTSGQLSNASSSCRASSCHFSALLLPGTLLITLALHLGLVRRQIVLVDVQALGGIEQISCRE